MANLKQIKVGNTTYNIEPYTSYLPLSGGTLTGKLHINAPLDSPGSSNPSLAINYSTSAQTISDANLNMIKFGSLDNYIGEAPASRTIEGIPAFAFHTTMGNNSEFAWLSAGWDHRMSLGAGGLTLHKGKLTLVDDIVYKGAKSSGSVIKFMNNTADEWGNGIKIGGGGATIIGGGESVDQVSVNAGDEVLYLMNDSNIEFYSNCQNGMSSAKCMTFDTSGNLNIPTNVVGSSSSNRLIFRHLDGQNCNGDYNLYLQYHQPNTRIYLNGSTYYIENGSYYNGTAAAAGNADTVDGDHSSAFARVASHNDLTASGNEFTFASSGYSGPIYLNWRTAGGTNGNITEYILGNGAGGQLGAIIHSGNIGSQNVNYANSAGSASSSDYATSSHLLRTYNSGDGSHGADYYLKCKHNVDGDGRFKLQIIRNDGSVTHSTSVDYAKLAGSAGSVAWGNIGGKPSTFPPESHMHSEFSSVVGFDHDYYSYGEMGSWRLHEYTYTGNTLDIRYGKIKINAQEKTYSISFSNPFDSNTYAIVCGIYRDNRNSWFWSPLVTNRKNSGFSVYVRGNTSGDNSGTLMYIAIRSN